MKSYTVEEVGNGYILAVRSEGDEYYCTEERHVFTDGALMLAYLEGCLKGGPLQSVDMAEIASPDPESPEQPTEEPQAVETGADDIVEGLREAVQFAANSAEPVANTNGADAVSPVIDATEDFSDEAVRAAGGEPVSRVDALNAAEPVTDWGTYLDGSYLYITANGAHHQSWDVYVPAQVESYQEFCKSVGLAPIALGLANKFPATQKGSV